MNSINVKFFVFIISMPLITWGDHQQINGNANTQLHGNNIVAGSTIIHHHYTPPTEEDCRLLINLSRPWNTPYQMPEPFTKRVKLRNRIQEKLNRNSNDMSMVGLYGLGGVGKTYLALDMIYNPDKNYNFRGWISSADKEEIKSTYLKLGSDLCLFTDENTEEQKISLVKNWLNRRETLLLVFDNVSHIDDIQKYLPDKGDIIVTTRNFSVLSRSRMIEIDEMEEEEAISLLINLR